jgi:hypothetical protein
MSAGFFQYSSHAQLIKCKGAEEKEISTSAKDKAEGTKIAFSVIKKLKTLNKWLEGIVANWDTIAKSGGGGGAAGGNSSATGGAGGNGTAPAGGAGAANASGAGDAAGGNATAAAGGAGAANGTVKAEGVMEETHRGSARGTHSKHYMCFYTK